MNDRWEYKVMTLKAESGLGAVFGVRPGDDEATDILNREGAQGWELVAVSLFGAVTRAYLKRRK